MVVVQAAVVLDEEAVTNNITISVHYRMLDIVVTFEDILYIYHCFSCSLVFLVLVLLTSVFTLLLLRRSRGGMDPKQLLTISYKEKGRVPVVAHVPAHPITFREFRKYLGISSKSSLQLVFLYNC